MERPKVTALWKAAILFALTGCTSLPYDEPAFDAGSDVVSFDDPSVNFPGMAASVGGGNRTLAFFTHGMCPRSWSWVDHLEQNLERSLGQLDLTEPKPKPSSTAKSLTEGIVYRRNITTPTGSIEGTFYLYSPMIEIYRQTLGFDWDYSGPLGAGEFRYERAKLNKSSKLRLMNDCLVDAVVASGKNGEAIHVDMMKKLCAFFGGSLAEQGPTCALGSEKTATVHRTLYSESLGSQIMTQALLSLQPANGQEDLFAARLATVDQIFLSANQIPLLQVANMELSTSDIEIYKKTTPPKTGETSQEMRSKRQELIDRIAGRQLMLLEEKLRPKTTNRPNVAAPLRIIAFTDPNDLLSYRLPTGFMGTAKSKDTTTEIKLDLINVIVSNAPTYSVPFFPKLEVELPNKAHCDYDTNPDVIALMIAGNDVNGPYNWREVRERLTNTQGNPDCTF